MLPPVQNPALFPSFVAQCTVRFDDTDARELDAQFPGVVLPASLARAVRKRQVEFLAGRYCAREALRRCSVENSDTPIRSGPHREPQWPAGIVGAITHTHGYASVALARSGDAKGIGLDAEVWMGHDRASELVDLIANRAEVDVIVRATGFSFARALTLMFSAKETLFKCLFPEVKRYFDFRDVAIVAVVPSRGDFSATLLVTLTPFLRAGQRFEGRFEYDDLLVCTAMVALAL